MLILTGGYLFFGDAMSAKKVAGILVAFVGIFWYSDLKLKEARRHVKKLSSQGKIDYSSASKDVQRLLRRF